jgi:malate synthase
MEATAILTAQACAFVADLERRFGGRRRELIAARADRRAEIARTGRLDFRPETRDVREGKWRVPPPAPGLVDRRVEITGPTERKMTINAMNSGAKVWLADLEDANTPHWDNVIGGQINLFEAVRGTIRYRSPEGKHYTIKPGQVPPTIVVRPRGWHLDERHLPGPGADKLPTTAALVDFGLYAFHNAAEQVRRGSGPYFYLPKMESRLEARLWRKVFEYTEDALDLAPGTIRATALIETIPAAFEMDEILYELGPYAAGLNAGRWDYLFSLIKYFRDQGSAFVLPDRNSVTMTAPFMQAYAELLVATCHRRGAHAIGGMAAFIPSRRDTAVNETAFAKVREDKERESGMGFDGSWVAHPDLVPLCKEVFDAALADRPHQIDVEREPVKVSGAQLLDLASTPGAVTEAGLRNDVSVGLQYIEAWLRGNGAVAINNLMEDAATAEIARSQVWQWTHQGVTLDDGRKVNTELVSRIIGEELAAIRTEVGAGTFAAGRFDDARKLFEQVALADDFVDFLTVAAYELIP